MNWQIKPKPKQGSGAIKFTSLSCILVLLLAQGIHLPWEKDITDKIQIADRIWSKIKSERAATLN